MVMFETGQTSAQRPHRMHFSTSTERGYFPRRASQALPWDFRQSLFINSGSRGMDRQEVLPAARFFAKASALFKPRRRSRSSRGLSRSVLA